MPLQNRAGDADSSLIALRRNLSFIVFLIRPLRDVRFAVMPYGRKSMLLAGTMSADCVKYQADSIAWWIEGRGGALYDVRSNGGQPVLEGCA